jgi:hypothetical protein
MSAPQPLGLSDSIELRPPAYRGYTFIRWRDPRKRDTPLKPLGRSAAELPACSCHLHRNSSAQPYVRLRSS